MGREIRAVIFDLGGVLMKHRNFVEIPGYVNLLVPAPGGLVWNKQAVRLFRALEVGKINARQFYDGVLPFLKRKISFSKFEKEWLKICGWRPAVAELVKQLKRAGYKIGIVSNCDPFFYYGLLGHYGLKPFINAEAPSFKARAMKPQREIFDFALRKLRLAPEQCIFIDDLPIYVKAARNYGLHAVQFRGLPSLKRDLGMLGIRANLRVAVRRQRRTK